jgi:16S rRNA (guanine527-N7)-methyltransferase
MTDLWKTLAARAGLSLSERQHQQLSLYLDLLLAANATMNLTGITDRALAEVQHVGDALTLLPFIAGGPVAVADVGSGGGVPGIPLAIARPDASVSLIESTKKKAAFLQQAATELGLENLQVIAQRAEEVGQSDRRESYDVAVARAVATLGWLAEWCLPLVKVGGKMLAMKGKRAADELPAAQRAIRAVGGGNATAHPVDLPGAENLVVIEVPKLRKSDLHYPRDPTIAKGRPM